MFDAYQDTFSMIGLMLRDKGEIANLPADFTNEDGDKIYAYLKPFVDDGFIRAFQGNEYIQDFNSGDTWVALVWSGDLANSAGPDDYFAYPTEGLVASTDNMLIPKGAVSTRRRHGDDRLPVRRRPSPPAWRPASSTSRRSRAPPRRSRTLDPELAKNPLLFPPADVIARTYAVPGLRRREERLLPGPHRPAHRRLGQRSPRLGDAIGR